MRADISLLLTIFLLSLVILGLLQALYDGAVLFKLIDPWLHPASGSARQAWSIVVLNSATLALACSTYYSFCGNAAAGAGGGGGGGGTSVRDLVCSRWLPPVTTREHPVSGGPDPEGRWVGCRTDIGAQLGGRKGWQCGGRLGGACMPPPALCS